MKSKVSERSLLLSLLGGILGCLLMGGSDWLMIYGDTAFEGQLAWLTVGVAQIPAWRTPEDQKEDPFVQGMDKIYKQLMTTLEGLGVKPIEAVGNEFDPNFHNAVMHEENEELGENIVSEEFKKGYMYRDSVVRHSMVKVAN